MSAPHLRPRAVYLACVPPPEFVGGLWAKYDVGLCTVMTALDNTLTRWHHLLPVGIPAGASLPQPTVEAGLIRDLDDTGVALLVFRVADAQTPEFDDYGITLHVVDHRHQYRLLRLEPRPRERS